MNFKQEQALQQLLLATAYVASDSRTDLSSEEIKVVARDAMVVATEAFDFVVLRREDGHLGIMKRNVQ